MKDEERETYLLASRLSAYRKKVNDAEEIIHKALSKSGDWVISFSGGKDSTVLADLLSHSGWKGHGIYFWYSDYENPEENTKQVEWANQKYGYDIQLKKCYGSYDAWKESGHFFVAPETKIEHAAAHKCSTGFKMASKKFMQDVTANNIFMGLCKDESRARQISLNMRGGLYQVKERCGWTCCPLANWTGTDVWAYITSNNLPYLQIYDLPYWPRERIRNELTVIYCPESILRGELMQYRIAYPELYSRLTREFPEVSQYV